MNGATKPVRHMCAHMPGLARRLDGRDSDPRRRCRAERCIGSRRYGKSQTSKAKNEFVRRFPAFAAELEAQIAFHAAVGAPTGQATHTFVGSETAGPIALRHHA